MFSLQALDVSNVSYNCYAIRNIFKLFQLRCVNNLLPPRGQSAHSCDHVSSAIRCCQIVRAPVKYSVKYVPKRGLYQQYIIVTCQGVISIIHYHAVRPTSEHIALYLEYVTVTVAVAREVINFKVCWDSKECPIFGTNCKQLF